jgi:hypothetical protein
MACKMSGVQVPLSPPNIMELSKEEKFVIFHVLNDAYQNELETIENIKPFVDKEELVQFEKEKELLYSLLLKFGKEIGIIG